MKKIGFLLPLDCIMQQSFTYFTKQSKNVMFLALMVRVRRNYPVHW